MNPRKYLLLWILLLAISGQTSMLGQGLRNNLYFLLEQAETGGGPLTEIDIRYTEEKQIFDIPVPKVRETPEGFVGHMRLRLITDSIPFQNGLLVFPSFDLMEITVQQSLRGQDTVFTGIAYPGTPKRTYRNVFNEVVSWLRMGRRNQLMLDISPNDTVELDIRYAHMTDMWLENKVVW
ncbi:MAG: hypothetical protein AAFV07_11580, partial [Bacteroidota bacterium]